MQKRLYFLLGLLTGLIMLWLLTQKSREETAHFRASQAQLRVINQQSAKERAAREAQLTSDQKLRMEIMRQESRMRVLEEMSKEQENTHGRKIRD